MSTTLPSARLAAILAPQIIISGDGRPHYKNYVRCQSFLGDDRLEWPIGHRTRIKSRWLSDDLVS